MPDQEVVDMFHSVVLKPGLKYLENLCTLSVSKEAEVLLLTTALQESGLVHRLQVGGPARSYWQFEQGGGVRNVVSSSASALKLSAVCQDLNIPFSESVIFEAMAWNDQLAVVMARLNYWLNPLKLPDAQDVEGSWNYYVNTWHPGKPRKETWAGYHAQAYEAVLWAT